MGRMRCLAAGLLAILAILPGTRSLLADTVVLRDGRQFEGRVLKETPRVLTIQRADGTMATYLREQVVRLLPPPVPATEIQAIQALLSLRDQVAMDDGRVLEGELLSRDPSWVRLRTPSSKGPREQHLDTSRVTAVLTVEERAEALRQQVLATVSPTDPEALLAGLKSCPSAAACLPVTCDEAVTLARFLRQRGFPWCAMAVARRAEGEAHAREREALLAACGEEYVLAALATAREASEAGKLQAALDVLDPCSELVGGHPVLDAERARLAARMRAEEASLRERATLTTGSGWNAFDGRRPEEARALAVQALDLAAALPPSPRHDAIKGSVLLLLASADRALGAHAKALQEATEALACFRDPHERVFALTVTAEIQRDAGRWREAFEAASRGLALEPQSAPCRRVLEQCKARLDEAARARAEKLAKEKEARLQKARAAAVRRPVIRVGMMP